jgi:hypothetical protein
VPGMQQMFDSVKTMAREAGRDPSKLELIVRANVEIHDKQRATDGTIFTGTLHQIGEDVDACKALGAHEIHFDPTFTAGGQRIDRWLDLMEQLWKLV